MVLKIIAANEIYLYNSENIGIVPGRKYRFTIRLSVQGGQEYAGYLTVIALDASKYEIARYSKWLKDSAGKEVEYTIIFKTPERSHQVLLGCRINVETPRRGDWEITLPSQFPEESLSVVGDEVSDNWDSPLEYIKPLYLDPISLMIDDCAIPPEDADISMIIQYLDNTAIQKTWKTGFEPEIRHWTEYLLRGIKENYHEQYRLDHELMIADEILACLDHRLANEIRILDVGAGPLTTVGKKWPGHRVSLTAIDPLAPIYDRVLSETHTVPPVRTLYGQAESLSSQFPEEHFDIIHCANALDHCYNPIKAIQEMTKILNKDGALFLKHFSNEAEKEGYSGFHQWNIWSYKNRFIIWNRNKVYDVHQIFRSSLDFTVKTHDEIITIVGRKK